MKSSSSPMSFDTTPRRQTSRLQQNWWIILGGLASVYVVASHQWFPPFGGITHHVPMHAQRILSECASLKALPGPPESFASRIRSERAPEDAPAHFIRNATIWTGRHDGHDVVHGDILFQDGLIKAVGRVPKKMLKEAGSNLVETDIGGAWVTPGIFDIHSHLGVASVPELRGNDDSNSWKGLTMPWLRSMDGFNVFDDALELSIAGGLTTALILPGSADAIGGQAYAFKLIRTREDTPTSMILEPPFSYNGTNPTDPPRWRHMKHATGENPSRAYSGTRMDTMWAFREAYDEARKLVERQDEYCNKAAAGLWNGLAADVPKDIKWEALADVLRGKVKVNIHSYSPDDFDGLARLSNEFKFHIAAIHHAHSAYLVIPLLEKFYGGKPAVAMFATNARYKIEAYRGSEFAPKILNDAGFQVAMKSDHPVLNSRYLLFEAAQAHIYGLPANKAIQSVTTIPAALAGFGHRLGYVQPGYDADLVVWDSHPLALGATPQQVVIDGIPQYENPVKLSKPDYLQKAPKVQDWDKEAKDAIKYRGLPPLQGTPTQSVAFVNVKSVWERGPKGKLVEVFVEPATGVVQFTDGKQACSSFQPGMACSGSFAPDVKVVDLEGGSISPGLISFGGLLGVVEMEQEWSTNDGFTYGPFDKEFAVVGNLNKAVDGISFEGRSMLLAYRSGVTTSVAAPQADSMISGLSVAFSNGARHSLEEGAIVQDVTALHVKISPLEKKPSLSTQIGLLRQILLSPDDSHVTGWFRRVAKGELPLILHVHSADVIAKLLSLKAEVEAQTEATIKMTFFGALESHLLAKEIAAAGVSVIVSPPRSFPSTWNARRILPGPPLSAETLVSTLVAHNVTVGLGIVEGWEARNTRFDVAWTALDANGRINRAEALALASTNLEKIFGIETDASQSDWVAYRGGDVFDFGSKVVGVASGRRRRVDMFVD